MPSALRSSIRTIAAVLSLSLVHNQLLLAQTPQQPAPITGPVPAQIAAAHKVFVANLGADANFPINPAKAYSDFYNSLQAWGHYQLVATPAEADLVFQLRDIAPITNVTGGNHTGVYSLTSPAFQLTIIDAKSNIALWTITSPVTLTGKKQIKDHWVNVATTNLLSRVKVLAGQPLTATESDSLTTFPKDHGRYVVPILIVGGVVGAGLGSYFLYRHAVSDQKNQQDAFCKANNIPLSQCAGG